MHIHVHIHLYNTRGREIEREKKKGENRNFPFREERGCRSLAGLFHVQIDVYGLFIGPTVIGARHLQAPLTLLSCLR